MMNIHIQLPDVCDPLEYVILGVACISTNCYVHTHHVVITFGTIVISKEALHHVVISFGMIVILTEALRYLGTNECCLRTNGCCMYIKAPEP
jgi:hypothetical protein